MQAYVGLCPEGFQCCHNDGNPANNKLENLRWDTPKNNTADKRKHGTINYGEKNPLAKLNKSKINRIKALKKTTNLSYSEIGRIYEVDHSTIYKIIKNKRWKHLNKP